MQRCGASFSSWYGHADQWPSIWENVNRGPGYESWPGNPDELRVPWFLLWETAWLVANTPIRPGARILDMGGAGSLFSCYHAARGHEVVAIDINRDLCRHANAVARKMGWRLTAVEMDMTVLDFPKDHFDHVFSVCVFEHLPVSGRVRCGERVRHILKPGGTTGYTFDYDNPQAFGRLSSPGDVYEQLVRPSGLDWRGKSEFHDNGRRYLATPQAFGFGRFTASTAKLHAFVTNAVERKRIIADRTDYTFGAVFMERKS
jgi:SAM-dependent methyltransferase